MSVKTKKMGGFTKIALVTAAAASAFVSNASAALDLSGVQGDIDSGSTSLIAIAATVLAVGLVWKLVGKS